jgi:hypothetical protein
MRRREFIAGLGSTAATRAQQAGRVRRIGVLMFVSMDDPAGQSAIATFQQALRELGWTEGLLNEVCAKSVAKKIVDKKADYVLSLKGNQGTLREDVEIFNKVTQTFRDVLLQAVSEVGSSREVGKDGGDGLLAYLKVAAVNQENKLSKRR